MRGIGTNQQKHRENQKKQKQKKQYSRCLGDGGVPPRVSKYFFLVFFCFLDVFGFLAKNAKTFGKTKKTIFQRSWPWGGSHQEFPNIVFFCFLNVFWFLSMGSSPAKRFKVFFYVIITWRFMQFFSVYGTKWWTDNLKSRQVERVLTKFKGCEPRCRKVQKVAALVGSGGVTIYIYVCVCDSSVEM